MDFFARKWLLAQIVVLGVQIPLRMEVQRSLFCINAIFFSSTFSCKTKFSPKSFEALVVTAARKVWATYQL